MASFLSNTLSLVIVPCYRTFHLVHSTRNGLNSIKEREKERGGEIPAGYNILNCAMSENYIAC